MRKELLIILLCVVVANHAHPSNYIEVTKGRFPFMAFLYYQDPTIIESNGNRFFRSAVITTPYWLLSAAIDPPRNNEGRILGFPDKTLLARAGAIIIDSQITLNKDDNEQEREIVQLVRPKNHDKAVFWQSDITLLKTVEPFTETPQVAAAPPPRPQHELYNKQCIALMYVKSSSESLERALFIFNVKTVQSANNTECGSHFYEPTMICAKDSDELQSDNYCQGNSGGPLICEDEVAGLQTYIKDDCRPPHKYQLLSKWHSFIQCGVEEKCNMEKCDCTVTNKDDEKTSEPEDNVSEETKDIQLRAETSSKIPEKDTPPPASSFTSTEPTDAGDVEPTTLKSTVEQSVSMNQYITIESLAPPTPTTIQTMEVGVSPTETTTVSSTEIANITGRRFPQDLSPPDRRNWFSNYVNEGESSSQHTTTTTIPKAVAVEVEQVKLPRVHHHRKQNSASTKFSIFRKMLIALSILVLIL